MRAMRIVEKISLIMILLVVAALILLLSRSAGGWAQGEETTVERLTLPVGDVEKGRMVFKELRCNACHEIAADIDMAKPVATKPGPVLGLKQANYKRGFLSESIIFPSHAIAPGTRDKTVPEAGSRMGDFSDTMTVRQLVDLVAYLKSLDEEV